MIIRCMINALYLFHTQSIYFFIRQKRFVKRSLEWSNVTTKLRVKKNEYSFNINEEYDHIGKETKITED